MNFIVVIKNTNIINLFNLEKLKDFGKMNFSFVNYIFIVWKMYSNILIEAVFNYKLSELKY